MNSLTTNKDKTQTTDC